MTNIKVGFVGVGFMGHGMAKNIVEKGFPLTVLDRKGGEVIADLTARGAATAKTPAAVGAASDVVLLCVTDSLVVEQVIAGADGLASTMKPGSVVVDCSTADPNSTLRMAALLKAKGIDMVDAPLSRTPKDAWAGTLQVMAGGDEAVFARVRPVLATFADTIVHLGPVGIGHKMKLVNNFLAMSYGALYAEALTLANKVGITPKLFDSVIRGGRMDCPFYQTYMKWVLERDENAHKFTLKNAHKDLRYVADMANAAGVANAMGAAAKNTYAIAEATGAGDKMVPMISDVVAALSGTRLA